jgi:hypothetical protein
MTNLRWVGWQGDLFYQIDRGYYVTYRVGPFAWDEFYGM